MFFSLFLIFFGAAVLATLALYARQAMLLSYIALGAVIGPWGLDWISNPDLIADISNIGILFLLFLLGLNLEISELAKLFREAIFVTVVSCATFFAAGLLVALLFSFNWQDAILTGLAMMFSSTIISLKLLPTHPTTGAWVATAGGGCLVGSHACAHSPLCQV